MNKHSDIARYCGEVRGYETEISVEQTASNGDGTLTKVIVESELLYSFEVELDSDSGRLTITSYGNFERELLRVLGQVLLDTLPDNGADE